MWWQHQRKMCSSLGCWLQLAHLTASRTRILWRRSSKWCSSWTLAYSLARRFCTRGWWHIRFRSTICLQLSWNFTQTSKQQAQVQNSTTSLLFVTTLASSSKACGSHLFIVKLLLKSLGRYFWTETSLFWKVRCFFAIADEVWHELSLKGDS